MSVHDLPAGMAGSSDSAMALSDGAVSGLFSEALAVLIYVIIVLALVVPPVLQRVRGEGDTPARDRN